MISTLSKPSPIRTGAYKNTTNLFFSSSKLLEAQITEIFDQVWPTVTALKNLRWQVRGYCDENNVSLNSSLSKKFVEDSDKTNRPNLYRACIQQSWEDQEYYIVKNLLVNLFACYEAWCEAILTDVGVKEQNLHIKCKHMQFPVQCVALIRSLQNAPMNVIANCLYTEYTQNKNHHPNHIDNYLKVYRYFKECRNSMLHSTGIVTQKMANAFADVSTLQPADIDVSEMPEMILQPIGDSINVTLRGVVGFSQIILRLVSTIDIELIKSAEAVNHFISIVKATEPKTKTVGFHLERNKKILSLIQKSRFKRPNLRHVNDLYDLLLANGIVK